MRIDGLNTGMPMSMVAGVTGVSSITSTPGSALTGAVDAAMGRLNVQRDEDFAQAIEDAIRANDDAQLMDACKQFEAFFINMMFRAMRRTTDFGEGVMPRGTAETIFQEMLDEEKSRKLTEAGGIGLAVTMFNQMQRGN